MSVAAVIDLETISTRPTAAIVAIGAALLDTGTGEIHESVAVPVSAQSCIDAGLDIDGATLAWWMTQPDPVRAQFQPSGCVPIGEALDRVHGATVGAVEVWCNWASFDFAILAHACARLRRPPLWDFRSQRCYGTLRKLLPHVPYPARERTAHTARGDAIEHARHLYLLLRELRRAFPPQISPGVL